MDFNIKEWLSLLLKNFKDKFCNRLIFVGHIGSYVRGEAGENSDIDVNVILDKLDMEDLVIYRNIIKNMPYSEKACGFVSSLDEIKAWPKQELFQFVNGCDVLHGNISDLIEMPDRGDLADYIRNSSSFILHDTRHKFIYSNNLYDEVNNLEFSYKNVFFILQVRMFLKTGKFILTKKDMLLMVDDENDKQVLEINMNWSKFEEDRKKRPDYYFKILIEWSSRLLVEIV